MNGLRDNSSYHKQESKQCSTSAGLVQPLCPEDQGKEPKASLGMPPPCHAQFTLYSGKKYWSTAAQHTVSLYPFAIRVFDTEHLINCTSPGKRLLSAIATARHLPQSALLQMLLDCQQVWTLTLLQLNQLCTARRESLYLMVFI